MTAKEYLSQIRQYDAIIAMYAAEIDALRTAATSVTVDTSREYVQSNSVADRTGIFGTKIVDKQLELQAIIDEYAAKRQEIMHTITLIRNEDCIKILWQRYIARKTFEQIAVDLNYSWRHTMRLHKKALELLQVVIDCH